MEVFWLIGMSHMLTVDIKSNSNSPLPNQPVGLLQLQAELLPSPHPTNRKYVKIHLYSNFYLLWPPFSDRWPLKPRVEIFCVNPRFYDIVQSSIRAKTHAKSSSCSTKSNKCLIRLVWGVISMHQIKQGCQSVWNSLYYTNTASMDKYRKVLPTD